jgi:predicted CXXCH cytochrome family protein
VKSLRELYGNVLLVDSGNVASDTGLAGVIVKAMGLMRYGALGVGVMEASLGQQLVELAEEAEVPLVGEVGPESNETKPGRATVQVGEVTVGIVCAAWTGNPDDADYREQLRRELEAARAEADFVVLLSQLGRDDDKKLLSSEGFKDLADVVVGGPVSWYQDQPDFVGRTLLLPGSRQGREVGVLEVKLADEGIRYHHEMVRLVPELPEDAEVKALIDAYYEERKEQPHAQPLVSEVVPLNLPDVFTKEEGALIRSRGYLTGPECGRCHADELKQWQSTPHATALQTLIDEGRTVRECLVCHSEANRRGLPYSPEGADQFGVDCSACHGAGLYHTSTGGEPNTIVRKPTEAVCLRCHTNERDHNWDLETRLPPVLHTAAAE